MTISLVSVTTIELEVTWSYKPPGGSRRKRAATNNDVSVVVYYQKEAGVEVHYPIDGHIPVETGSVRIKGEFEPKSHYDVWLAIHEGDSRTVQRSETFSFQQAPQSSESNRQRGIIIIIIIIYIYFRLSHSNRQFNRQRGIIIIIIIIYIYFRLPAYAR